MIMDLLQKLGIKAGEDYIKGERESAPDLNNPEEMNQLLMDLVMGASSGVGGTLKTGVGRKLLDKIANIKHPNAGLAYGGLTAVALYNKLRNAPFEYGGLHNLFSPSVEPKAHDSIDDIINLTDPDSPNFPPIPSFLGGPRQK